MAKLTFAALTFNPTQTPISTAFDDIYFSTQDGLAETHYVFFEGNQLWQKWQAHTQAHFVIAETGFGTGLNFFAVATEFERFLAEQPQHPLKRLYFISFEKFPLTAEDLQSVHATTPFAKKAKNLTACWHPHQKGCQRYHFGAVYLDLWFGDMAENLPQLGDSYHNSIHCWFLDGFSPDKNPEMWNDQLYQQMFRLSQNGASFATFTAASAVRKGLQQAGFQVFKRKGFGKKREMLWGEKPYQHEMPCPQFPYYQQGNSAAYQDIAIIGGGVASLFAALALLERGKKVTLYCKDTELAQNASGNRQGAIYPQFSDDDERNVRFYVHSFDYALQRLALLSQEIEIEQDLSGVALYAYNDKTSKKLAKIAEDGWGEDLFQLLNAQALSEKIGLPVPNGGAFIAQGGWLSPQQLVQQGFQALAKKGLKIVLNHTIQDLQHHGEKWQWQHQGQTISHEVVILANGHTITDFSQTEGIPLYPVRGQVSHIPTTEALSQLKCVLCFDGYITPMANHSHCLGASHIRDDASLDFSVEEHQQNLAKFQQNLTPCQWTAGIDLSANSAKVGVRSALRDRVPMVGSVPNFTQQKAQYRNLYNQLRRKEAVESACYYPHLYLIAGLGSRGLTTAPLLGEVLASQMCGEPIPLRQDILHALSPNRTWLRHLLKGRTVE
ncbi:bifunctional tRNA (5-methylaminomethyl-2-thiouridylate)-methyltransferase MnmD/FAD-dependent cmnm(5)s(2)U34 oxidoreductase MnmC [Pasteurellaceae bacterium Macca]|nr:bifunctional tRNA (5-methylaminomethyl-2-thiouridylate)-methyltransferase MnmD/FAD-dependent cmnm(5)s(2)U34 oxidoreductase MnmC [Pasteurellaceae bacterium Macca]MCK3656796.1 bifunctional tRNA (5-methylaminomethyl-2-thiouridylate)-methyltransferase MnmD/FAD-dependent cmnm(5)s(2)U34 oxidoreductase MnmC [Pasteurellaceae bacterium Macca]